MQIIFRYVLMGLAAISQTAPAAAQTYPSKPIRIIAAQSPGGATDIFARLIGQKMSESWKTPVVIENRGGAAGAIGAEMTAKAPPDGYTLLLATAGQIVINQSLNPQPGFDPVRDLAPVAFVASSPLLLVSHPSVPAKSVRELVALARAQPNRLAHGSGGTGSPAHLAAELLKSMTNVRITHVPFKGVAPSVIAVMGGEIDMTFATIAATLPQVKAGRLRALAISTAKRSPTLPEVPTIAESGVPGYEVTTWYGMFGPAALPKDLIGKLNVEITRILALPEMRERMTQDGADPGNLDLNQFAALIKRDAARWAKLIKEAGIKAD
jgi:tripartite-type tricarboxylate transporter receptor subunit TctC